MAYVFRRVDEEHGRLIGLLARSIHAHYPGARIVLLTNELGRASGIPPSVDVRVADLDPDRVMVERLRAYRDYVRSLEAGTGVVFTDTDMLVMRRFDELMAPDAHLSVTIRDWAAMQVNAGLIVARIDAEGLVRGFFDRLCECCEALSEDEKRWYGDQIALERLLAPPSPRPRTSFIVERDGVRVRFAPGRFFNNTPRPWMLALGIYRRGVRILHFKGDRKARMPVYARRYLRSDFG